MRNSIFRFFSYCTRFDFFLIYCEVNLKIKKKDVTIFFFETIFENDVRIGDASNEGGEKKRHKIYNLRHKHISVSFRPSDIFFCKSRLSPWPFEQWRLWLNGRVLNLWLQYPDSIHGIYKGSLSITYRWRRHMHGHLT